MHLPTVFQNKIINTFGDEGREWLAALPALLRECEARFNVKIGSPFPRLSFNYVADAVQADGTHLVIKLCVPTKSVANEIQALEWMRGDGMVNLIGADHEQGILLLEKLGPGEMLSTLGNDDEATGIALELMQKIARPYTSDHPFPTTIEWFNALNNPMALPKSFPSSLIDKAKCLAEELHDDMSEPVLLHGDLHHFNILSSQRQPWLSIDPKGVIGDPVYEVGALLRNPIPDIVTTMNTKKRLTQRVAQLSQVYDRQKVLGWGFAQAVLAAVWCVESKANDWMIFLNCAEILSEMIGDR